MDDLTRHPMLGDKDAREELVKQTDYEELKGNLIAYAGCGDILSQGDFHSRVISQLLVNATIAISELLERAEKAERDRDAMRDAAIMQQKYQRLYDTHKLSKKAMCELCVPFRDKYGLTDLQTLRIARKEMDLMEIVELLQPKEK